MTVPSALEIEKFAGPPPNLIPRNYDLEGLGYVEAEFEARGQAQSYQPVGEHRHDGRGTAEAEGLAPFTTRLLVRRPADPADFSGTVVVEWLNVSGGIDASPDWDFLHRHLIRKGHAWIGVSAQKAGIDGGGLAEGVHLKMFNEGRYGHLSHPGDAYSFDIYSQIGQALREAGSPPLGDLVADRVMAVGESQSASFLATYVNMVDPLVGVFDGFFLHGRAGIRVGLDGAFRPRLFDDQIDGDHQRPEQVRADARVPVLMLSAETDVTVLSNGEINQPDGDMVRVWELAGAAHADTYLLVASRADGGQLSAGEFAQMLEPITELVIMTVEKPINSTPVQHYVAQAAFESLDQWVDQNTPPPIAARLDLADGGHDFRRSELGIAQGGIRNPWVDAPIRVLSGLGQYGEGFASLFGTTAALDPNTVAQLYPGGRDDYLAAFTRSLDRTIADGFILEVDRNEILAVAAATFDLAFPSGA